MAKRKKKELKRGAGSDDQQVKDSNELLALIRHQMALRRSGQNKRRAKGLNIPGPSEQ